MDAGPVTVSGPSSHAASQWLRLPIRRLRTGYTKRTLANDRVAQHAVDPLGIGVGVPRLLADRATGNQPEDSEEAARPVRSPGLIRSGVPD